MRAFTGDDRHLRIEGDRLHPANGGDLCDRVAVLEDMADLDGRLLHPMVNGRRQDWDRTITRIARQLTAVMARHGPGSVALHVGGGLLTEDYYVANKLMKGFIGSANIDTNSRLCMSSAVAGHNRAFGEDVVPASYGDLDRADLIVLVGSNTAWCHPIVYQRIQAARAARGTKLVVIDPRRTETCEGADLHLAVKPGTDVALMNGLLAWCEAQGIADPAFMADHVTAPEGFWEHIRTGHDLWTTAATCDIEPALLKQFFELFAATPRTITMFSQGINQSIRGTDQVNAIINVHLATGRFGKPGAAPFSITGQPNAMGGREVGGLASTLAAHMDFAPDNVARVGRFWAAPTMATKPGLKAVDLFRAINEGRIKALWVMATNPAVSLPDAGRVREALESIPFLVVSDIIADTDSSTHAHVRLPAAGWGEKDGTVTNSDRTISRQRPFMALPGEAKPDWWIVTQVARRMGWRNAFAYERPADIWREHARLTAYQNDGARVLNLRAQAAIGNEAYEAMAPFRWGGDAPFAGGFSTPDGKARLVLTRQMDVQAPLKDWPLTLNTGRYRDQWHTMTRTGLAPKLARHREEPLVEIHPRDAQALGIADRDLARVQTAQGHSIFRVAYSEGQRPGEIFTPIHWTDQISSGGRTGLLPRPLVDPHSGQPGFKSTPASIERVATEWKGFLILRGQDAVRLPCLWATKVTVPGGALYEVAGNGDAARLDACLPKGDRVEAIDRTRGTRRVAIIQEGRLAGILIVTRTGLLPSRDWLIGQLSAEGVGATVLAARGPGSQPDKGATICVCFDIGLNQIVAAIRDQQLVDVPAIGKALGAGTNCGSCRPAIANILMQISQETLHAAE